MPELCFFPEKKPSFLLIVIQVCYGLLSCGSNIRKIFN